MFFKPGKMTIVMDAQAGSSAKGLRGAHIWKHHRAGHTAFAANTFMSNAAHTITHSDGREIIHQCLNSITTLPGWAFQCVGPGSVFSTQEFLEEVVKCQPLNGKVYIHPNAAIVTERDVEYERGRVDFDGNKVDSPQSSNLRIGSTLHGVGAARARRLLRRDDSLIAKNVPELKPYCADTSSIILNALRNGLSGLGEIAQGFQLSLYSDFYPRCTSRNCTTAAFLDDSMLPATVLGPLVLNCRTFPIRVNSNKYIQKSTGSVLTWEEVQRLPSSAVKVILGNSGGHYADQRELTWEEVSKQAGTPIFECTSLTKLPRRVYTFSKTNLFKAIVANNTGDDLYLSVNFMNYVDASVKGARTVDNVLTDKVVQWLRDNILTKALRGLLHTWKIKLCGIFVGTERTIDDSVFLDAHTLNVLWA